MDRHSIDVCADRCSCRGGVRDSVCAGLTDENFGGGDSQCPASNLQGKGKRLVSSCFYIRALSFIADTAGGPRCNSCPLSCPRFNFSWRFRWFDNRASQNIVKFAFIGWMCATTYTYIFATMTSIHFTIVQLKSSQNSFENRRIKDPIIFPFHSPRQSNVAPLGL